MRRKWWTLLTLAALLGLAALSLAADELKTKDYCFGVMGFEGDGGPIFIIAEEKAFKETGEYVGPAAELVPAGFIRSPYDDTTFEYRGTIAAGRAALEAAGFKECPEIVP